MHRVGEIRSIKSMNAKENGKTRVWKLKSRSKSKFSSRGSHKGNKGPKKYIFDVPDSKEEFVREDPFEEVFRPWSDWLWSEDYQVFYRGRLDANDMWDYEYDYQVPNRETPRFVPLINVEFVESEKVALAVAMELPDLRAEEYTWMMGGSGNMKMGVMEGEKVQGVGKMKGKGGNEDFKDRTIIEKQTGIYIEDAGKEDMRTSEFRHERRKLTK
ncbi:hypothetical protein sscle_01g008180 [Sclerotinia sclerotiorum 1980 UF-70]|uniref:Uncharacterized protein n=1 Tax=Sclerotinia sclerotiorum (strain ATCC 18683 / 1980 / Ss-1) TaxID=665079 RepID=A0A1D9PTK1_SCLS1|nr:hypothetical protein sscle_01g008180 [Sclerotinia sclerotiorum 1980 UF-70]